MAEWSWTVNGELWSIAVAEDRIVALPAAAAPVESPRNLMAAALEHPFQFEALRRALTPEDRVCVVLDERLPHLAELISGLLDHLATAGIDPDAVTLLSPEPTSKQSWIDDLPDEFADVKAEVHQPADRKKHAYLNATKTGEPIYLNRTLVEAEFAIVLGAHRHDGMPGEAWLAPGCSDAEHQRKATIESLDDREAAWLLGTPFFVRVIEGAAGSIDGVIAGFSNSQPEADRRRDERWNRTVHTQPNTVIVEADTDRFDDLAAMIASAERVVGVDGRIVVLMKREPKFPPAVTVLQRSNDVEDALHFLKAKHPEGWRAATTWAQCAQQAALFLAGPLSQEFCEELFATKISSASELQRLIDGGGPVMNLADAHLARVEYVKREAS